MVENYLRSHAQASVFLTVCHISFSLFSKTSYSLSVVFSVIGRSSWLHLVAWILLDNVPPVTPVTPVSVGWTTGARLLSGIL